MNMNMTMNDQEQQERRPISYHSINDNSTGPVIKSGDFAYEKSSRIQVQSRYNGSSKKPKLHLMTAIDGTGTGTYLKMKTQKTHHLIPQEQERQQEPLSSSSSTGPGPGKGISISIPSVTSLDRLRESSKRENMNTEAILCTVDRICEDSVASDMSGLTDADAFKSDEYPSANSTWSTSASTNMSTNSSTNSSTGQHHSTSTVTASSKNFRSVVRAPEPPALSRGSNSNSKQLTDIQSETTATTVCSERDQKSTEMNNNNNNNSTTEKKRSVSFCEVQVRNYERVLEINPSVTSGPAVGLGWNYSPEDDEIFALEMFEDTREYTRRGNSMEDLALPRDEREDLLRSLGYTQREIAGSIRQILRVKNQRKQTVQNLHASSVEEFLENATRKMKHVLTFPLCHRKKAKQLLYLYPQKTLSTTNTTNNLVSSSSSVLRKISLIHPSAV